MEVMTRMSPDIAMETQQGVKQPTFAKIGGLLWYFRRRKLGTDSESENYQSENNEFSGYMSAITEHMQQILTSTQIRRRASTVRM